METVLGRRLLQGVLDRAGGLGHVIHAFQLQGQSSQVFGYVGDRAGADETLGMAVN